MNQERKKLMMMLEAFHLTNDIDFMCKENEEEESPASKCAWVHQYENNQ